MDISKLTLEEYIRLGNPMLSHTTESLLCKEFCCCGRELREKTLLTLCSNANYGDYARREIERWQRHENKEYNFPRT